MLVLTRKTGQSTTTGDPAGTLPPIEIKIIEIQGDQVRLGITAPLDVRVDRAEIAVQRNQEAETNMAAQTKPHKRPLGRAYSHRTGTRHFLVLLPAPPETRRHSANMSIKPAAFGLLSPSLPVVLPPWPLFTQTRRRGVVLLSRAKCEPDKARRSLLSTAT